MGKNKNLHKLTAWLFEQKVVLIFVFLSIGALIASKQSMAFVAGELFTRVARNSFGGAGAELWHRGGGHGGPDFTLPHHLLGPFRHQRLPGHSGPGNPSGGLLRLPGGLPF